MGRAIGAEVTATLGDRMTYGGRRAIAVVGHGFYEHRHTIGCVAFVAELDHIVGFVGTGATGDGAINGVAGHVGGQGFVHRQT